MNATLRTLIWNLIAFVTAFHACATDAESKWRTPGNGGINALYCYLRIHDKKCDYASLASRQTQIIGNGNHNAATLIQLAAEHGVNLRLVSMTMKEIESSKLPLLVYLDSDTPNSGAFMLLFSRSKNALDLVNGPSCTVAEMTNEEFRRVWSGFALVETNQPPGKLSIGAGFFALGCAIVAVINKGQHRRND